MLEGNGRSRLWKIAAAAALMGWLAVRPAALAAHCDTLSGPVVKEGRAALASGDITPVLKWVKSAHEGELRAAFARARAVRAKGSEAQELADLYFLENLVRLHRAGEGAPYTGLKDEPVDPIVAMSDKALASGTAKDLIAAIGGHLASELEAKYRKAVQTMAEKDRSVEAGREFVEAYVIFTHYIEAVHMAIAGGAVEHH